MAGFVSFEDEPEQYQFCYMLRLGNAEAKQGEIDIVDRVIKRLRTAFPKARILVRLDGGTGPEPLTFLEGEKVDYILVMAETRF